jgi:hypothetical protein
MSTQNQQSAALSWNALFLSGSVVSLSISLWRARAKILPSDLGIEDTAEVKAALSLGCHRLAPASAFDEILRISREAQKAIDQLSMNFGLIKGARFIPEKNLAVLLERLHALKAEFYVAAKEFATNYDPMREGQLPVIKAALEAATTPAIAKAAYDRLVAEYPTAAQVLAKFSFSHSTYSVTSPKSAEAGKFAAEETEEVKSIVADMVKQLRDETSETLKTVMSLATKGGKLNKRTIEAAQETIGRIRGLNILGDHVLNDQLDAMEKALAAVDRAKVGDGFVQGLNAIQATLETSIADAVAQAEKTLTGVGHRSIEVEDEEVPALPVPPPLPVQYANGHAPDAFEGL